MKGRNIHIHLVDGTPSGIRIGEIRNWTGKVVVTPRSQLADLAKRDEARRTGVYCLVGGDPDRENRDCVYIGEADNVLSRLTSHDRDESRDFWTRTIVIISKDENLTKSHVRYLEWFCIRRTREVGRYALDNGNDGGEPFVTEPMRADLMDAFDALNILTSSLGFPVVEARPTEESAEVFHIKGKDAEGRGQMVEDGFTVLPGSRARKELVPSAGEWVRNNRKELLEQGILKDDGDQLLFVEPYTFNTPSAAAIAVLGRNANGCQEWKTKFRSTLDEVKRQSPDAAEESTDTQPG